MHNLRKGSDTRFRARDVTVARRLPLVWVPSVSPCSSARFSAQGDAARSGCGKPAYDAEAGLREAATQPAKPAEATSLLAKLLSVDWNAGKIPRLSEREDGLESPRIA
jgi:hypothetical protein